MSAIQTLSNEGNSSTSLVIDIGDLTFAQLIEIFAGGQATWKVDQSGTAHVAFTVNAAGNALQLGQASDTVEVIGALQVDVALTLPNGQNLKAINLSSGGVLEPILGFGASGDAFVWSGVAGRSVVLNDQGGTNMMIINTGAGATFQVPVTLPKTTAFALNSQSLVTGNTIILADSVLELSCSGAVTGIIMTTGAVQGQIVVLVNVTTSSSDTITFAASGSNVAGGSNVVLKSGSAMILMWSNTTHTWHQIQSAV